MDADIPVDEPSGPHGAENPFRQTEAGDRVRAFAREIGVEWPLVSGTLHRYAMKHECEIEPVIELARLLMAVWRQTPATGRAFLTSPTFRNVLSAMSQVDLTAKQAAGVTSDLSTMLGQVDALQVSK